MKIENMEDLFLDEIRDLYDAEKQLVKALPKMADAATSDKLRQAFESHLEETRGHVERLERIFGQLNQKSSGESCDAMKGLIKEGEQMVDHIDESPLRDAGMIGAANRVEHYEIAASGTACTFAQMLGYDEAMQLLQQTLEEEKAADQKLTRIAEGMVNERALELGSMRK